MPQPAGLRLACDLNRLSLGSRPARLAKRGEHRQHQIPDRGILFERRANIARKNAALICGLRPFLLGEGRHGHHRRDYQHYDQSRKSSIHGITPSVNAEPLANGREV
jgi:hypothetical protein